jgi:hypothetical protein
LASKKQLRLPAGSITIGTVNGRYHLVKVLKRCFSHDEWVVLKQQPSFKLRLRALESVEDVESLVFLGRDLLRECETPRLSSLSDSFGE